MTEHERLTPPEPDYPYKCDICKERCYEVEEIGGDIFRHGKFVCNACVDKYLEKRAGECTDDYITSSKERQEDFYLWWWEGFSKAEKAELLKTLYDSSSDNKQELERDFCLEQDDFPEFAEENLS